MSVLDRMEISQMAVANALTSVQDAQARYNSALQEFGTGSEQAVMAQNSLERATNQYEAAQMRANLSLVSMSVGMIGMIPDVIRFGTTMTTMMRNVEIATLLTSARLKMLAPELLILSAIAGGVYYLWSTQTQEAELDTKNFGNTAVTSFDAAGMSADQLREKIKKLDEEINKTKESAKQAQTPLDQYLSYHADTSGIRKAKDGEFIGDRTKLPSDHPLYQPSGKTLDLMGQKETAEMDLYKSLGGKTGDRGGAQYFINPPTQPMIQAPTQSPASIVSNAIYGKGGEEGALKELADKINQPKTMNVNITATINKNDDVGKTFKNIGEGLYNGYATANMKPR